MADAIDKWISINDSNSITAIWHDESYLNRYLADNTKTVRVLGPSYAYPEQAFYNKDWKMPFECKLLLLDKQKYITISGSRMSKVRESIWGKIERKIAVFLEPVKRRLWLGERTAARRSP